MKRILSPGEYFEIHADRKHILFILRELLLGAGLEETLKWGIPCYTSDGKNVVGLAAFKSYVGLWFYQGALLKDNAGVLVNAQKGKTKALRQWRFRDDEFPDAAMVSSYIQEAIRNQHKGKRIETEKNPALHIPLELKEALESDSLLKIMFGKLTPGRQREFATYIDEARRAETRKSRMQKIIPLIRSGIGLNDKYKK